MHPSSNLKTEAEQAPSAPWDGSLDDATLGRLDKATQAAIRAARRETRDLECESARNVGARRPFGGYEDLT